MLQYKSICIPDVKYDGVPYEEFKKGITVETGNRALAPINAAINEEGKRGWTLHSLELIPQTFKRQKSMMEKVFGWIPLLGKALFPTMIQEVKFGTEFKIYVLIFVREV